MHYHNSVMRKRPHNQAFEVVEAGYDRIGDAYTKERGGFDNLLEMEAFTSALPEKAKVLDAGSGTGIPVARHLVASGFEVVGIDLSKTMLSVAQKNVPGATFRRMNMVDIDFPPESFDGVISTYAIIHVPREEHAGIFRSFHTILKPGGVMLVSVAAWAWEEIADYMGVEMFWSHYGPAETESLITEAGFEIEFGRDVVAGGEKHHWVLARQITD